MSDNDVLVKNGLTEIEQLQDDIDELQKLLNDLNYKYNEKECKDWPDPTAREKGYRIIGILKKKRTRIKQLKGII